MVLSAAVFSAVLAADSASGSPSAAANDIKSTTDGAPAQATETGTSAPPPSSTAGTPEPTQGPSPSPSPTVGIETGVPVRIFLPALALLRICRGDLTPEGCGRAYLPSAEAGQLAP